MKNVQIIDGADNCTYSIYAFTEEEFDAVFPDPGQDVEFIEDAAMRLGDRQLGELLAPVWKRLVPKPEAQGIHGTLFYELLSRKRYYPNKQERDMKTGF